MNMLISEDERIDELGRKGYQIIQNRKRFCFGIDAVLLADFANARPGQKVLDLGTGTGIIPILMEARYDGDDYYALEIQKDSVDMARRSVRLNHLEDKIQILEGDIKEAVSIFEAASFDVITTNPPYMTQDSGIKNPGEAKAIARHEILCNLEDVISQSSKLLKNRGRFYMVHRPFRLTDMMYLMRKYHLEPKRIRMVHSYVDSEASMVLVEACKCGRPFLKMEKPCIIYQSPSVYTDEIYEIYYGKARKEGGNADG